jgi:hypothetical protein
MLHGPEQYWVEGGCLDYVERVEDWMYIWMVRRREEWVDRGRREG